MPVTRHEISESWDVKLQALEWRGTKGRLCFSAALLKILEETKWVHLESSEMGGNFALILLFSAHDLTEVELSGSLSKAHKMFPMRLPNLRRLSLESTPSMDGDTSIFWQNLHSPQLEILSLRTFNTLSLQSYEGGIRLVEFKFNKQARRRILRRQWSY